ncbi:fin bud initiation factor a [Osmerus eperlanus]|uniref:fin bud initiation factor a n=1 Tax=Osmerus eperlanus TaxID=29151 RepID=UPI002E155F55
MDFTRLMLFILTSMPLCFSAFSGPLYPEMSNGTFHHFFVPDGDYEENDDPETCQMLFKFTDRRACGTNEDSDSVVRNDFFIMKHEVEAAARLLEGIGRTISYDLDGKESYGKFLSQETSQISEAFTSVEKSLLELEVKFKQSQDNGLEEEHQLNGNVLKTIHGVTDSLRETVDISVGLKDKHELLSLVLKSHGTRLSRLRTEYLNV